MQLYNLRTLSFTTSTALMPLSTFNLNECAEAKCFSDFDFLLFQVARALGGKLIKVLLILFNINLRRTMSVAEWLMHVMCIHIASYGVGLAVGHFGDPTARPYSPPYRDPAAIWEHNVAIH